MPLILNPYGRPVVTLDDGEHLSTIPPDDFED